MVNLIMQVYLAIAKHYYLNILLNILIRTVLIPFILILGAYHIFRYWRLYILSKINKKKVVIFSYSTLSEYRFNQELLKNLKTYNNIKVVIFSGFYKIKIRDLKKRFHLYEIFPFGIMPLVKADLFLTTKSSLLWNRPFCTKKVHFFHSPVSIHMFPEYTFDFFNIFFVNGPHQKNELNILLPKRGKKCYKIFEIGSEVIDSIAINSLNIKPNDKVETIIFAPTLGNNSSLVLFGENIINTVLNLNLKLIFRPSPSSIYTHKSLIDNIVNTFKTNPNFIYDDCSGSIFENSSIDLLITDWSGISFEFALGCLKPILFIDTPSKILDFNKNWNNYFEKKGVEFEYRDKIGRRVANIDEIPATIDYISENYSILSKQIENYRNDLIFNICKSHEYSLNAVLELLKIKK